MAKKYLRNTNGIIRAVTSDNLQLEKPLLNENYDIEVHNRNMDKIDGAIQEVKGKIDGLELVANKVMMNDGSTVETTVTTNKSNISILQSNVNNNTNEIQSLKQSVSNGKTLIASAITDKKVPTSNTDSFQTMANNIAKIEVPRLPKWVTGIRFECSKMSQNILNSTSNLIDDKIILIAGERPSNGGKSAVVRLFDPVDNSWIDLPSFPVTTYGHSSVVVNGKVYAGGGNNSKDALYCFDYSKNTWSVASNIPNQRTYLSMASIGDNIYCIGGSDTNYNECYNVSTNTWTTKKTITKARSRGLCFALDNKVYVLGGKNGTTVLDKHECYDPVTDTWSDKTKFKICDAKGDVYNGCFYVIGGERSTSYSGAVSKYDPTTDTWGSLTGFGRGTEEHTSTFAGNCLYTFGGMATGSSSAEIRADGYLI